jgi:Sec-independent protein translocase protein TatA
MFGWGELAIVIVLAIILLGPDKLPEVARTLGKVYAEYLKAKKRLELEILYGYELPSKDVLDQIARKKLDLLEEVKTEKLKLENYLNGDVGKVKGGDGNVHGRPK